MNDPFSPGPGRNESYSYTELRPPAFDIVLNTATQQELAKIPKIGPHHAYNIVRHRPFRSWDDLKRSPGITTELIEELQKGGARLNVEDDLRR